MADGVKTKLAKMRTSLLAQGISMQGIDDAMLLRFLRARAMHVPRAAKMLAEQQTWRASFVPLGFIPESQIESELAQGKAFLQGVSKKTGYPLLFMIARHHLGNRTDFQEFKRFVVYTLDKTIASAPAGVEKYTVIVDLEGIGYKNMDVKSLLSSLQLGQKYYPERLSRMYFVKVPSIFTSFWKMASPFIDKVTREKIYFLDGNGTSDSLIQEFSADNIPKVYGGKAEMTLIQDALVPDWPPTNSAS
ncbi:hypothetical protein GOP47_0009110 [Adiantum capillus-veneris]|uniref:CRAL-TRIO domain-containing protein n=1 Tax=Adiantum capillus-veneris TaxID=13818 RepID=A0A9D4V086_ADICA|nr:hypothetical protein GOP47_0008696 [Adiantum capillus-veneris]KAI5077045.1 hypothetical protein GOP47_0009110 [Adiantum capillus-veneris]